MKGLAPGAPRSKLREVLSNLTRRARAILYAVVTEFIASGEPVGSRTLVRKYGFELSAATVRNVLADLEVQGFLAQPHTSAGRVPTESAFRLFIDALMQIREPPQEDADRLREWLENLAPGADILRETGRLLSELTGAPAIMARRRIESRGVIRIRFIPTRPEEILAVIVLSDGVVENRFLQVEQRLGERDFQRLHNMLDEVLDGRTLVQVRDHFAQTVADRRDELGAISQFGLTAVNATIDHAARAMDIIVEGHSRLLDRIDASESVQHLLRALDERERLVELLDKTLSTRHVQVFLGQETEEAVGYPVSLVAAPYEGSDGRLGGALGIIGPTRMDYPTLVPIVGATAQAASKALQRARELASGRDSETD